MKDVVTEGLQDFGFTVEDLISQEHDAALGNGGLGRLASCFLDSMATCQLPAWGYGLRYRYGMFKQQIVDGNQIEHPDYWLDFNPWEFPRPDVTVDVQFYGRVRKNREGKSVWQDGEIIEAVAHDVPIPGYDTRNTNSLRLWSSRASSGEFDFQKFDAGDYENAVADQLTAETISAVLYPNDDLDRGRELRLKQQYLWCAASLSDIIRRFKKSDRPWSDFTDYVVIQLNGTHPALAIVELQRILVDLEELNFNEAWQIVSRTFAYTTHTTLPEVREKWPVPMIKKLLPRHMQLIYEINHNWLERVKKEFPGDLGLLNRVSIIEETDPKTVRTLFIGILGSFKVNGVSELHSEQITQTTFKDFVKILGRGRFTNVTNGITPRRWLHQANPKLSALIASKLGSYDFLKDLYLLQRLKLYTNDSEFKKAWADIKLENKARLANYITDTTGVQVNINALFDVQVKWFDEHKRQQLNIFGVIHRYLKIKAMDPSERSGLVPRVSIFGGKAAPGNWIGKKTIHFINKVATTINKDPDVGDLLKVVFIEDYNVSKAELICPASDLSEHISTAGTEASGTSNMKFALNGGLIIATIDGSNIEVIEEIGEDNTFLFGHLAPDVEDVRRAHAENPGRECPSKNLLSVFNAVLDGMFGDPEPLAAVVNRVIDQDHYIISDDFDSYIAAQDMVDETYRDQDKWIEKSILSVAGMGKFSSDRSVWQYSEEIWNIESVAVKDPKRREYKKSS
ncbi:Non-essential glycogen phosphorylase [Orbilia ellipsospora]|uniref:Alpha-1,4 glucan phosphorylase n=1 Tax=Orbilia ellipsospora TaxID=2528407 RepID=A0AAV9WU58_9PEZI